MQSSLTVGSAIALFSAMLVLAAIPSVSVLAVVTRTATAGLRHGLLTTLGIVTGDLIFIVFALWGLTVLATQLGSLFIWIQFIGGAYLMGLGLMLWKSQTQWQQAGAAPPASLLSSFMTGLLITLGDQKATLFYLGFFPAFLDLAQISYGDAGLILGIAILAVGGAKLTYAVLTDRTKAVIRFNPHRLNRMAAIVLMGVGLFLMIKTIR